MKNITGSSVSPYHKKVENRENLERSRSKEIKNLIVQNNSMSSVGYKSKKRLLNEIDDNITNSRVLLTEGNETY